MKTLKRISPVVVIIGIALGFMFHYSAQVCQQAEASGTAAKQGCINQGSDCRVFGTVICWSQRHMSWKSEHEPHFLVLGKADRTQLGLAWPPYVVFNSPDGTGHWRMFPNRLCFDEVPFAECRPRLASILRMLGLLPDDVGIDPKFTANEVDVAFASAFLTRSSVRT